MLLDCGAITFAQLDEAILVQNEQGQLLGDTLVSLGYVSEEKLAAVLAQRLVRRVCPDCSAVTEISPRDLAGLRRLAPGSPLSARERYPARDGECSTCDGARFRGRTVVAELLEVDEQIAVMVADAAADADIRRAAIAAGMSTIQEVGLALVRSGVTTAAEVLRTIPPAQKSASVCGVAA